MQVKWSNNKVIFFAALVLSIAFYFPTYKAGLVTDWLSWYYWYQAGDFGDIIHCFGYRGLHQFFHLIHYPIFRLCDNSGFSWYLIYAFMHGVNAFLVFYTFRRLILFFKGDHSFWIALITAIIFLISPFQVEVLVWKVCFHYMMVLALFLLSINSLIPWITTRQSKHLYTYLVIFGLSLFTLEIALVFPFIFLALLLCIHRVDHSYNWGSKFFIKTIGLPLVMLVMWFVLNKMLFTDWVGHYGAEKHLNFDFWLISGNVLKYIVKYIGFVHYWPFKEKMLIYEVLDQNKWIIGTGVLLVVVSMLWIWFSLSRMRQNRALILWSLLGFFISLAPVANLFFVRIMPYENDRYGYVASAFLYFTIVLFAFRLKPFFRYIFLILIITLHAWFFRYMIVNAHHAGEVMEGLVESFDFYDCDNIYILCDPENYHGMSMLRDYSDRSLALHETLDILKGQDFEGNISEIGQVNMHDAHDGVEISQIDSLTIQVINTDPGTWFWRKGLGLSDYEREEYRLSLHGWYFELTFKEVPRDACFIYSNGDQWKEHIWQVDLSKN